MGAVAMLTIGVLLGAVLYRSVNAIMIEAWLKDIDADLLTEGQTHVHWGWARQAIRSNSISRLCARSRYARLRRMAGYL